MTDYFALLNEPRRPWLDPDALKTKYLTLSTQFHPDRSHGSPAADRDAANRRYTEINAAYQCLREPRDRLRHLLELELGHKPSELGNVPPELADSFFVIGKLLREADALIAEKSATTSPILQAAVFARATPVHSRIQEILDDLARRTQPLLDELQALNPKWETDRPLARLEEIARNLGYFNRWSSQLRERMLKLTL